MIVHAFDTGRRSQCAMVTMHLIQFWRCCSLLGSSWCTGFGDRRLDQQALWERERERRTGACFIHSQRTVLTCYTWIVADSATLLLIALESTDSVSKRVQRANTYQNTYEWNWSVSCLVGLDSEPYGQVGRASGGTWKVCDMMAPSDSLLGRVAVCCRLHEKLVRPSNFRGAWLTYGKKVEQEVWYNSVPVWKIKDFFLKITKICARGLRFCYVFTAASCWFVAEWQMIAGVLIIHAFVQGFVYNWIACCCIVLRSYKTKAVYATREFVQFFRRFPYFFRRNLL